jgi:Flp pilus assembly pilin Flp
MTFRVFAGQEGQALAEYALLFALVTLGLIAACSMFGLAVSRLYDAVSGVMP